MVGEGGGRLFFFINDLTLSNLSMGVNAEIFVADEAKGHF